MPGALRCISATCVGLVWRSRALPPSSSPQLHARFHATLAWCGCPCSARPGDLLISSRQPARPPPELVVPSPLPTVAAALHLSAVARPPFALHVHLLLVARSPAKLRCLSLGGADPRLPAPDRRCGPVPPASVSTSSGAVSSGTAGCSPRFHSGRHASRRQPCPGAMCSCTPSAKAALE